MEPCISRLLFVYSSLRKGFHQQRYHYVSQFFSFISDAKVKGIANEADGEILATPADDDSFLEGELYQLNDEHDFSYVFGQLDDYEGLVIEQGERPLYQRKITKVYKDNGETVDAWIYWYNGNVENKIAAAKGNFSH